MPSIKSATLAFLAFLALANAVSEEQQNITVSVTEASQLIQVAGDTAFNDVLPGYGYSRIISVNWNVPHDSLKSLDANEVKVFVRIAPSTNDSWIALKTKDMPKPRKKLSFELSCVNANGSCKEGSILSRQVTIYLKVPQGANYPHSDGITVSASLTPFPPTEEEALQQEIKQRIEWLKREQAELASINASSTTLEAVSNAVNAANEKASNDEFDEALQKIAYANSLIASAFSEAAQNHSSPSPAPHTALATAATTWPGTLVLIILAAVVAFLLYGKTDYRRSAHSNFLDDAVAEEEKENSLTKKVDEKPGYKFY